MTKEVEFEPLAGAEISLFLLQHSDDLWGTTKCRAYW